MRVVGIVGAVVGVVLILLAVAGMVGGQAQAQITPLIVGIVLVVAGALVAKRAGAK
jgi:hypothetical protein